MAFVGAVNGSTFGIKYFIKFMDHSLLPLIQTKSLKMSNSPWERLLFSLLVGIIRMHLIQTYAPIYPVIKF